MNGALGFCGENFAYSLNGAASLSLAIKYFGLFSEKPQALFYYEIFHEFPF